MPLRQIWVMPRIANADVFLLFFIVRCPMTKNYYFWGAKIKMEVLDSRTDNYKDQ